MTSFADLWETLPEELYLAVNAFMSFWWASGVPKHSKPNLAIIGVFVHPSFWPAWALVMSHGDVSLLGSYISRGEVADAFLRICRLHLVMQLPSAPFTPAAIAKRVEQPPAPT